MPQGQLAYIVWVNEGAEGGHPSHPIAPGGQPGYPSHPIYNPPYPSQGPGFPTHPIAPGGQPPGIWGGAPPYVDIGFPGPQPGRPPGIWGPTDPRPSQPIYIPITPPPESGLSPEHPIYVPVYPDNSLPGNQPYPDHSLPGNQPYPDNSLPGGSNQAAKAAFLKKAKAAVDFWTGNLPENSTPTPTPQ
jgi:hypothetical protein